MPVTIRILLRVSRDFPVEEKNVANFESLGERPMIPDGAGTHQNKEEESEPGSLGLQHDDLTLLEVSHAWRAFRPESESNRSRQMGVFVHGRL